MAATAWLAREILLIRKYLCPPHTRLMALFPELPRWASTRKVKPIWILLKQETVSGSGISWAICKSAPCSKQITTPAPHHSDFYRPDALPVTQPTASKHWRHSKKLLFPCKCQTKLSYSWQFTLITSNNKQQLGQQAAHTCLHVAADSRWCCVWPAAMLQWHQCTEARQSNSLGWRPVPASALLAIASAYADHRLQSTAHTTPQHHTTAATS